MTETANQPPAQVRPNQPAQPLIAKLDHGENELEQNNKTSVANFQDIIPSLAFGFQPVTVELKLTARDWIMLYECASEKIGDVPTLIMELLDSRETLAERWARETAAGQWLVNHLKESKPAEGGGK